MATPAAAHIQTECETAIKRVFDQAGLEMTVTRSEFGYAADWIERSITWMTENETGNRIRADCVIASGELMVVWIWSPSERRGIWLEGVW